MNLIIYDQLRRRWLPCTLICLIYFSAGLLLPELPELKDRLGFLGLWLAFITSFSISELSKGYARIALSLPLTARQIGRAFWWLSAGLPALSLTFLSGLGAILRIHSTKEMPEIFGIWLHLAVMGSLALGAVFWLFSGAPTKPSKDWKDNLPGQIYSFAFYGVFAGGGYLLYKVTLGLETKYIITSIFCGILAVLGWLRAEDLVVDYGGHSYETFDSGESIETIKPQTGHGGIFFLLTNMSIRFVGLQILIIAIPIALSAYTNHHINWVHLSQTMPLYQVYYFLAVLAIIGPMTLHLKFLRTLPLTSKQLAAILLCLILVPILISCGILVLFISPEVGLAKSLSLFKTYVLSLAPVCVLATGLVWHGEKRLKRIVVAVTVLIITLIPVIYQMTTGVWNAGKEDLALWMVIGFPLVSFVLSLFTMSYLLEKNYMTYRLRPQDINWAVGTNWS